MNTPQNALASFIGIVGLAVTGWSVGIFLSDNPPPQFWIAPALMGIGLCTVASSLTWLIRSVKDDQAPRNNPLETSEETSEPLPEEASDIASPPPKPLDVGTPDTITSPSPDTNDDDA